MNDLGIRTMSGKQWTASAISASLKPCPGFEPVEDADESAGLPTARPDYGLLGLAALWTCRRNARSADLAARRRDRADLCGAKAIAVDEATATESKRDRARADRRGEDVSDVILRLVKDEITRPRSTS